MSREQSVRIGRCTVEMYPRDIIHARARFVLWRSPPVLYKEAAINVFNYSTTIERALRPRHKNGTVKKADGRMGYGTWRRSRFAGNVFSFPRPHGKCTLAPTSGAATLRRNVPWRTNKCARFIILRRGVIVKRTRAKREISSAEYYTSRYSLCRLGSRGISAACKIARMCPVITVRL